MNIKQGFVAQLRPLIFATFEIRKTRANSWSRFGFQRFSLCLASWFIEITSRQCKNPQIALDLLSTRSVLPHNWNWVICLRLRGEKDSLNPRQSWDKKSFEDLEMPTYTQSCIIWRSDTARWTWTGWSWTLNPMTFQIT